ncbi:24754_t:CDS:1, partial [Gigaspora rosea]
IRQGNDRLKNVMSKNGLSKTCNVVERLIEKMCLTFSESSENVD